MLKVVYFAHYAGLYGANQSLMSMADGLRRYGIEPVIFIPEAGQMAEKLDSLDLTYFLGNYELWMAPRRKWWLRPYRLIKNKKNLPSLAEKVGALCPDIIHTNSSVLGIGSMVASRLEIPHVWHLREFAEVTFGMKYDLGREMSQEYIAESDAIVAISHVLKESLFSQIAKRRCRVVYNGVLRREEMIDLYQKKRKQKENSIFTFLMVGRISPAKGQHQAIRALRYVNKNSQLIIAGSGSPRYISRLKRLCLKLGVAERVFFLGFVDDPFEVYMNADVVLVCSKYEGMGRVTAEAMAVGVPLIGLDSTGTGELVSHGETGFLYHGTVEELASLMRKLFNSRHLIDGVRVAAHEKALKDFTIEACCDGINNVYLSL